MRKPLLQNALIILSTLLGALIRPGLGNASDEKLMRYAVVVGADDGGEGRTRLRYAKKDAEEFARVLESFGGVDKRDLMLLFDPDRFELESAFANMRRLLGDTRQSGVRQEIVVYYSGHSDEEGILLGEDEFPYREFKAVLADLPADVRIAILDSCSSGAFSRTKGGTRQAPFLVDSSINVTGHAFMTSSSADEAAQESDRIQGSFFSHYLTSGLRGAADNDRNRIVTLNEAYNYAFHETLSRTESTLSGPQHANYDFQLQGSGDLVLTDLRGSTAGLGVAEDILGRIFIRDDKGRLIAEINKVGAKSVHLGLDPGVYLVTLENAEGFFKGTVKIARGRETQIHQAGLNRESREITTSRGTSAAPESHYHPPTTPKEAPTGEVIQRPVQFGLFPGGISVLPLHRPEGPKQTYFAVNFIGDGHYLYGLEAGILGSIRYFDANGLQASSLFNYNTASTNGLQASGLFNRSGNFIGLQAAGLFNADFGDRFYGLEASGLFNLSRGKLYGLQAAALFNVTGEGVGLRASGLFNLSKGPTQGMHAAGLFNYVDGPTRGFTASGAFNINTSSSFGFIASGLFNVNRSDSMGFMGAGLVNYNGGAYHGFQGAGLVNVSAAGASDGFQGAGLVNFGRQVVGYQGAGLVNIASESMVGLQTGLVNIGGDVKGAQIGLVNIATEDLKGAQVGLVNIGGGVYLAPTFWCSGSSFINMGIKFGGRYTYALLGYGIHPQSGEKRSSLIYGFGAHLDFNRILVDADFTVDHLMDEYRWTRDETDMIYKWRPTVGYRLLDQLSIYAGPSLNLLVSDLRKEASVIPAVWTGTSHEDENLALSIDFTVGIQWEPKFGKLNKLPPIRRKTESQTPALQ